MNKQLQILVGMAVFATLALAVTLGTFAFGTAQPVQAQEVGSASRSFSAVDAAGNVTVTITIGARNVFGSLTETFHEDFTYVSSDDADAAPAAGSQDIVFTLAGNSSVEYVLTPPTDPGDYGFMGTLTEVDLGGGDEIVTSVGGDATFTVAADGGNGNGGNGDDMMRTASSVDARPKDPGDLAQITVKFETSMFLAIDESITLEVADDFGVPSSISASDVSISGKGAESADAAAAGERKPRVCVSPFGYR